jgi:glycosyltransferase involved in cell wall biosynthesis
MLARSGVHDPRGRTTRRVLFLLLDRRRGLDRFTLELARGIAEMPRIRATFCLPRDHDLFGWLPNLACEVVAADACDGPCGAPSRGVETLHRNVGSALVRHRPAGVVTLMPHLWTPMLAPLIRAHGVRYLTVVHDARPHPHHPARLLNGWALRDAQAADTVVTLSRSVADVLVATGAVPRRKLVTLFHPDLTFGSPQRAREPEAARPFRALALARSHVHGRLDALVGAVELLRGQGLAIALDVFGEEQPGQLRDRLATLGGEVENRRMADREMPAVLSRHHAVALAPGGACQAMVAAIALGAGLPLIGCRGDGLPEHVKDGATGVVAGGSDPASLAAAIRRLAADRTLYSGIREHIRRSAWERSMRRFAEHLIALATDAPPLPEGLAPRDLIWV